MSKLKPCPFCASDKLDVHEWPAKQSMVHCKGCDARVYHADWNKRLPEIATEVASMVKKVESNIKEMGEAKIDVVANEKVPDGQIFMFPSEPYWSKGDDKHD